MASQQIITNQMLKFGQKLVKSSAAFLLRSNVYGLVNLKPITPGHVLVVTKSDAKRLHDMTEVETLDFWVTVQEVSRVMEKIYKAECQICVQDGPDAGQSIDQVHCHIIPMGLSKLPKIDDEVRKPRTDGEMMEEANSYRPYFENQSRQ